MSSLVWFRRDLRVDDQQALYHATQENDCVIGIYIFCEEDIKAYNTSSIQQNFIIHHLESLSIELQKLSIPLLIREVKYRQEIPALLLNIAKTYQIFTCYFNQEYEVNEVARDKAVTQSLKQHDVLVESFHDQVLFPPGSVRTGKQDFYTVFTPFSRRLWQLISDQPIRTLPRPRKMPENTLKSDSLAPWLKVATFPVKVGEAAAKKQLLTYAKNAIHQYQALRDYPALSATSHLSSYLAIGVLSPRQCLETALTHGQDLIGLAEGARVWINELFWREFYKHVLVGFPRVCKNQPFLQITNGLVWDNNPHYFEAWCKGETGVPLVDAAMHELNETGLMHNRCRMVVAMFLSKNLWIDWRLGEAYFTSKLLDHDFSANNGGWQWSASTGMDAAPYFRIFNPESQAKRFDPEGEYIRQYRADLTLKPIVDLKETRAQAILYFKQLQQKII